MKLVVVGGAFAGLELLRQVAGQRAWFESVTLVDPRAEHSYTPLLHEAVSGRWASARLERRYADGLAARLGAQFVQGTVRSVVPGQVLLGDGSSLPYDALVVAAGSAHRLQDVRRDGAVAHVSAVKFSGDVGVVREALGAARRVTVVGDGLTGVEHAAELALWAKQRGASLEVRLTGRQELPLPHMPTSLRVCAARALEALGLARSSELVELPSEVGAAAGAQELFIWATGTAPVAGLEGLPRVEGGFVPVDRWLRVRGLERVFAIGDLARLHDEQGRVVPTTMRAAEAIFQGAWLGPRLRALCAGDSCAPYDAKPDFPFYGISLGDRAVFAYRRFGRNSRAGAAFRRFLTVAYWARLRL